MKPEKQLVNQSLPAWDHRPAAHNARLAIVSGGTRDKFHGVHAYGEVVACLFARYARIHGYSVLVERNLQRWSIGRVPAWGKIALLEAVIHTETLLQFVSWIDLDIVLMNHSLPLLERVLHMPNCTHGLLGEHASETNPQGKWASYLQFSTGANSSFWFSRDVNEAYAVNVNTGIYMMRTNRLARSLLRVAWKIGSKPGYWKRHDPWWPLKNSSHPYYMWPFEQGAIWDVLSLKPSTYMVEMCVAAPGYLQTLTTSTGNSGFDRHKWERDLRRTETGLILGDVMAHSFFRRRAPFALHLVGSTNLMRAYGVNASAKHVGARACIRRGPT